MQIWRAMVACAALSASQVQAGSQTGQVLYIAERSGDVGTASDSLVYLVLSGTHVSPPSCATGGYWMIRDAKSDIGKEQIATIQTAQAIGRSIAITGNGTCIRWGDGEDILEVKLAN